MKRYTPRLLLAGILSLTPGPSAVAPARPVHAPSLEELAERAELVAILHPESGSKRPDQLHTAGPLYRPRNSKDYQAVDTRFKVLLVLKQSPTLAHWQTNRLTLLHFFHAAGPLEFNGGLFAYFHPKETQFQTIATHRPAHPGASGPPTYLAFLRSRPDDRFEPVTGNYDSELSFRVLTTPQGGGMLYAVEHFPGSQPIPPTREPVPSSPGQGP